MGGACHTAALCSRGRIPGRTRGQRRGARRRLRSRSRLLSPRAWGPRKTSPRAPREAGEALALGAVPWPGSVQEGRREVLGMQGMAPHSP